MTQSAVAEWEEIAATLRPEIADAIEENVADQGFDPNSDEFWSQCVREAKA